MGKGENLQGVNEGIVSAIYPKKVARAHIALSAPDGLRQEETANGHPRIRFSHN